MQIELNKLKVNDRFTYDEDIVIDKTVYNNADIKDLKGLHLKGIIYYNSAEILEINLHLTGIMSLLDSITLETIEHTFSIEIEEEYSLNDPYFKEYYEKEQNILDIMSVLWENIVLEVPISITQVKDAKLSGEGWQLGEEENEEDKIDPRLACLTQLLDERKE